VGGSPLKSRQSDRHEQEDERQEEPVHRQSCGMAAGCGMSMTEVHPAFVNPKSSEGDLCL
jgi:hypothetical protein